jgi:hypothetical protein
MKMFRLDSHAMYVSLVALIMAPASVLAQEGQRAAWDTDEEVDVVPAAPTRTSEPPPPVDAPGQTDHERVVGHMGVGYLGINNVPVCDISASLACNTGGVNAPILGLRYWASERLGIEIGVGVGVNIGKNRTESGGVVDTDKDPTIGAIALHGGLPLALVHSRHFTFLFSPEIQFGFAKGSTNDAFGANEISVMGIMTRAGARIGAEVQFGFIGIPQLSLTAGIGLHGMLSYRGASDDTGDSVRDTGFGFGTNVQGNPWAIFTNGISALYYF